MHWEKARTVSRFSLEFTGNSSAGRPHTKDTQGTKRDRHRERAASAEHLLCLVERVEPVVDQRIRMQGGFHSGVARAKPTLTGRFFVSWQAADISFL